VYKREFVACINELWAGLKDDKTEKKQIENERQNTKDSKKSKKLYLYGQV
jgi:hypothetical protein